MSFWAVHAALAVEVRPTEMAPDACRQRVPRGSGCRLSNRPRVATVADRCECGLPLDPPLDQDYYWPSIDSPDPKLSTVVRYGEHPTYRRAVLVPSGWMKRGVSVDGSGRPSAIVPWERVGMCWAGTEHPIVATDHG